MGERWGKCLHCNGTGQKEITDKDGKKEILPCMACDGEGVGKGFDEWAKVNGYGYN